MISQYFSIEEFVPPEIFKSYRENSIWFIDSRVVEGANLLRSLLGPITINNWHTGGKYKESGLRAMWSTTGAAMSQHKFGRAIDIKVDTMKSKDVFKFILDSWVSNSVCKFFTTLEDVEYTKTWVHLDCRNIGGDTKNTPLIVKP